METVIWPAGYDQLKHQLRLLAPRIASGLVIAIDPSSGSRDSVPGFAVFRAGELLTSGEIDIPYRKPIAERLQLLHAAVLKLTPEPPDVFIVEEIKGQNFSHRFLHWALGSTIAAARTTTLVECPINLWKSLAKIYPGYLKGNAMDAEMIGMSVILYAKHLTQQE